MMDLDALRRLAGQDISIDYDEIAYQFHKVGATGFIIILYDEGGRLELLGPPGSFKLNFLHHVIGVQEQLDVAGMVQMEMGVNNIFDLVGTVTEFLKLFVDDFAALLYRRESATKPLTPVGNTTIA